MLIAYIQAALGKAKFEISAGGKYYAEIPGFEGLWAQADDLVACRQELEQALDDWLIQTLRQGQPLPVVDGLHLGSPEP